MSHIILNIYLEFYNYDILLVWVTDLIEIYQAERRNYPNNMICYL